MYEIKNRFDGSVIYKSEKVETAKEAVEEYVKYERGQGRRAYLGGADLRGAYLGGADLGRADLGGAYLGGAYLGGADLGGAKNYAASHDFCMEIVRRMLEETFTAHEWATIGKIAMHRHCWDEIRKYKNAEKIFKKIADAGWPEYLDELKRG